MPEEPYEEYLLNLLDQVLKLMVENEERVQKINI